MRICIIQSCYIPWKGFFDLLDRCDEYVVFDGAQYVKGHWHNRNRIKTSTGTRWLTIPVVTSGRLRQPICEVEIAKPWADRHWRILELNYKRAASFEQVAPTVKGWYERAERQSRLTDINEVFLKGIVEMLGLKTRITRDSMYPADGILAEKLQNIARAAGADRYLSGPSARAYLDESKLVTAGVKLEWMSYEGYPEYTQLHGSFEHAVTVLDLLFHAGTEVSRYFRCGRIVTADTMGPHGGSDLTPRRDVLRDPIE
jgi:WbqC-like protein family